MTPAVLYSSLFPNSSFLFTLPSILRPYFFEPWSPLRKSPESFGPAPPKAGKLSAFSFELISLFLFPLLLILIPDPYFSSNTARIASAISRFKTGLEIKARMPMLKAFCSSIIELKPVQSITGISGRICMRFSASFSPVI